MTVGRATLYLALCSRNATLREVADFFGLTVTEMFEPLQHARICKAATKKQEHSKRSKWTPDLRARHLQQMRDRFNDKRENAGRRQPAVLDPADLTPQGRIWCAQCEKPHGVTKEQAKACSSRFCKARGLTA